VDVVYVNLLSAYLQMRFGGGKVALEMTIHCPAGGIELNTLLERGHRHRVGEVARQEEHGVDAQRFLQIGIVFDRRGYGLFDGLLPNAQRGGSASLNELTYAHMAMLTV